MEEICESGEHIRRNDNPLNREVGFCSKNEKIGWSVSLQNSRRIEEFWRDFFITEQKRDLFCYMVNSGSNLSKMTTEEIKEHPVFKTYEVMKS